MELLSGKKIAEEMFTKLQKTILQEKLAPKLAVVLVGDDPASHLYVRLKKSAAEKIGMICEVTFFPQDVSQTNLEQHIQMLNLDTSVHGILIQFPLPVGFDEDVLVQQIDSQKDADGFHQDTLTKFLAGDRGAEPVFPRAIATLIESCKTNLKGKMAVALVNSVLFGKIIEQSLKNLGAIPTIIQATEWEEHLDEVLGADVVVTACGQAKMITRDHLSPNVIVIDGGITMVDGHAVGDVDRESVEDISGWLSPVPGGVGPVTVASLLARVVESARRTTNQ